MPPVTTPHVLSGLDVAGDPRRWESLGFTVRDGTVALGPVAIRLGGSGEGITAWSGPALDGLVHRDPASNMTIPGVSPGDVMLDEPTHPNGAIGLDHLVVFTPDFDRTARALDEHALPLKRIRDAGGFRQGFRRLGGPTILELVERRDRDGDGEPARFWGLTITVADLDAVPRQLTTAPKPAVQPGRQIVTVTPAAGLSCAMAFMDPE